MSLSLNIEDGVRGFAFAIPKTGPPEISNILSLNIVPLRQTQAPLLQSYQFSLCLPCFVLSSFFPPCLLCPLHSSRRLSSFPSFSPSFSSLRPILRGVRGAAPLGGHLHLPPTCRGVACPLGL